MYGKSYTILQSDLKKIQTWVIKTGSGLGLVSDGNDVLKNGSF